jgi:hypothetical protein
MFPSFAERVKADMAVDAQQFDFPAIRALVGAAGRHGDIDSALQYLKYCEEKCVPL